MTKGAVNIAVSAQARLAQRARERPAASCRAEI